MRELCEHLRKFQEEFESKYNRKLSPEELSYLEVAQTLIDGETAEEPPDE